MSLDRVAGLEIFARVAALGSFSAAARGLRASPTMITKHIDALEGRLGTKLVHRTTRRVTLTEAGRRYLDSVERILGELAEADALARAERQEVTGTLRLNAPVSFGVRELVPQLVDFMALHAGVAVDLGVNDRVVDLVDEGWDMAVRIGRLRVDTMIARKLAPCRLMLTAAPSYLARHGRPRRLADLAGHNCLIYTLAQSMVGDIWAFGLEEQQTVQVRGDFRASNGDALVAAALAGRGMIYQPTFLVGDEVRAGRLEAVELDAPASELLGVFAVYPSGRKPPAKVRALIDFLADRFGTEPPWDRDLPIRL